VRAFHGLQLLQAGDLPPSENHKTAAQPSLSPPTAPQRNYLTAVVPAIKYLGALHDAVCHQVHLMAEARCWLVRTTSKSAQHAATNQSTDMHTCVCVCGKYRGNTIIHPIVVASWTLFIETLTGPLSSSWTGSKATYHYHWVPGVPRVLTVLTRLANMTPIVSRQ